ncbi:MAG: prepilin-type N-terminal cleavage/methylation domain-containing protein [bacterium]|nr:prepilin-type N-terminal cleavage/methylation domain-containing protein [bacterium]
MKQKGQILIEALVAITVAGVGLLGVFSLLTQSLGLNKVVSDQFVASNLAMEGIELVKNLIDNNVLQGSGFRAWNEGNCLTNGDHEIDINYEYELNSACGDDNRFLNFDPSTGIYSYGGTEQSTRFRRKIKIDVSRADEIQVNSIVTWTGRGGSASDINLEDHFFRWRPYQCNDGLDNNGNGLIDMADILKCFSPDADTEN